MGIGHSAPAAEIDELREAQIGSVAVLTINRPARRNALTPEVLDGLCDALRRLEGNPDVRAVVLAGAGGAFSSGADLKAASLGAKHLLLNHYHPLISTLVSLELPVIGACPESRGIWVTIHGDSMRRCRQARCGGGRVA